MSRTHHRLLATAAWSLLACPLPALAQEQAAQPPTGAETAEAANDAGATQVGDIVVTAQRRAENLQKVPIVITAVSGDQLADAGVTSVTNLATVAPGLTSRTSGGAAFQPSLRGIGTSSNVVENPVALYIDGVYLANQNDANRDLPDVEQVAVLKGPQGTLFGRNATGGVLQITTRRPSQELDVRARAEIDNYATVRGSVFVSGGLTPGIAASVSAAYATQGRGYGDNFTTGNDTFRLAHSLDLRGKLLFEPGPDTSILLIGDYLDKKTFTYSFVPYPGTSFIRPLPGPVGKQDTYSPIDPFAAFKGGGASLTVEQDFGNAKLVSITAYRRGSTRYIFDDVPAGVPIFYVGVDKGDQQNRSFTQELQLVSTGDGPVTYTGGLYYYRNRIGNQPILRQFFPAFYGAAAGPPTANRITETFGTERTESVAPFAQIGVKLATATTLTLGGRYTYEKRELLGRAVLTRYNDSVVTVPYNPTPLTIQKPTWRIALDHQFTPDILGYVSYNRGIKSGGFNILNPANPAYLPERLDAYEAGFKTELFDRRLRLNIGGFYYDYNNLQVTQFVALAQSVVNGAKARLYGIDVDFQARISPELSFNGGFEVLDAKFVSYPNAVGSIPRATGGAQLIVVDASGNRIPQSQKFAGTLAADYERAVSFGTIHLNVTANYNGNYKYEADNFITQGAYTLLNTALEWRSPDDRYALSIFGRNLLDEIVLNNATSQAIGYPVSYAQPPLTFGIAGKLKL